MATTLTDIANGTTGAAPPALQTAANPGGNRAEARSAPTAANGAAPAGGLLGIVNADPNQGNPPPVREPGGYGPYDESESHLFLGPMDKGVSEGIARSFGLTSPSIGITDGISEVWDSLVKGAKDTFKQIRNSEDSSALFNPAMRAYEAPATGGGSLLPGYQTVQKNVTAAVLTPISLAEQGVDGIIKLMNHAAGEAQASIPLGADGRPDWDRVDRQRLGQAIGMQLSALGQLAASVEGEGRASAETDTAGAAARGVGRFLEDRSAGPGNALVRARAQNFLHGANPGAVLRDEPFHPSLTLEGVLKQTEAFQDRLHGQVQELLKNADTVRQIQGDGTIRTVPNVLNAEDAIGAAFDETMKKIDEARGLGGKAKIRAAVKEIRDDMLQDGVNGPPSEVNELKKNVGTQIKWYDASTLPEDQANVARALDDFRKGAYRNLNQLVDDSVGGPEGSRVMDLNRRYANLAEFEKLLNKRILVERGTGGWNALARKAGWSVAAQQLLYGNPVVGAGVGLNQMLRTTPGRIATARALGTAGRLLQTPAARTVLAGGERAAGAAPMVAGAMGQRVLAGGDEGEGQ